MLDGRTLAQTAVLLGLTVICGTLANATAGKERYLKWIADWEAPSGAPPAALPAAGSQTVPAAGAVSSPAADAPTPEPGAALQPFEAAFDRVLEAKGNGAVFLDARSSRDFAEGHIADARSFAVWESDIDDKIRALPAEVPTLAPIVVYCNGGNCEDSHLLREKLLAQGYQDVTVYKDGYPDWLERGQPTGTGAEAP